MNEHAAEPSAQGVDPYIAARDHAFDEAARERKTARSWRRLATASLVVSLGLLADNVVTTAKLRGPAAALVLTQDDRGAMRLLGRAGEAPVPADVALQAGVRTWLEDVRSIPGIDYALTRATIPMLEELRSMIEDGTAVAAWEYDETRPLDLDALSFEEAKAMLVAGRQVRRILGVHPLQDVPSRDEVLSPQDAATAELCDQQFEQRAQHSRGGRRRRRVA